MEEKSIPFMAATLRRYASVETAVPRPVLGFSTSATSAVLPSALSRDHLSIQYLVWAGSSAFRGSALEQVRQKVARRVDLLVPIGQQPVNETSTQSAAGSR
jgi:hypothetical protein